MNSIKLSNYNISMNDLNMKTLISLRYEEEVGIIKIYSVKGKVVRMVNGEIEYVK